jgi:hypothetical protein
MLIATSLQAAAASGSIACLQFALGRQMGLHGLAQQPLHMFVAVAEACATTGNVDALRFVARATIIRPQTQ